MRHAAFVARQGIEPCCRSDGSTDRCPTLGPTRSGWDARDRDGSLSHLVTPTFQLNDRGSRAGRLPWSPAAYPRVDPGRLAVSGWAGSAHWRPAPHRSGCPLLSCGCRPCRGPCDSEPRFHRVPRAGLSGRTEVVAGMARAARVDPLGGSVVFHAGVVHSRGGPFSIRLPGLPAVTKVSDAWACRGSANDNCCSVLRVLDIPVPSIHANPSWAALQYAGQVPGLSSLAARAARPAG